MTRSRTTGGRRWPDAIVRYGNFLFRYRNLVFPLCLIALLVGFPPQFAWNDMVLDIWSDALGLVIGFTGVVLRGTVVGLVYVKRGGVNKQVFAESLVTDGMFAHCRNPLYVGNLLVLLGIFVIVNNPWVYLLGGGFYIFSYISIVAAEEHYLFAKFGAKYAEYCARVPRWLFNPRRLRTTLARHRFDWRRVIEKEYSSIATWILMNLVVFAEEEFINEGLRRSQDELVAVAVAIIFTGFAVLALRLLKKAGRLKVRNS